MSESKISVLLVDDSAVIRGLLGRILEEDPEIDIVGTRSNGETAIVAAERYQPDIVVLDIEMPVMDGITALPKILETCPQTKVLICSTLSDKNADVSIKALELGASDCILKPSSTRDITEQQSFRRTLINLVRTLSGHTPRDFDKEKIAPKKGQETVRLKSEDIVKKPLPKAKNITLRKLMSSDPTGYEAIAIGSSTGGPQALFKVLGDCNNIQAPIFITQHMPKTFTKILAQHIQQNTGIPAHEAQNGMTVKNGEIYVAAGGFHMVVESKGKQEQRAIQIKLDDGPPENFCKPSIEPMLRSLIDVYGNKLLTVILTGMGHDGFTACCKLPDIDAPLIAQDEQTSIVWGMPGAVASAGICTDILPVDQIGRKISRYMNHKISA